MNKSIAMTALAAAFALTTAAQAGDMKSDHKGDPAMKSEQGQMQPERGAAYGADADAFEYGFNDIDRDKDGFISQEEAREHESLVEEWESADANRDGKVSEAEFSAFEDETEPMEKEKSAPSEDAEK